MVRASQNTGQDYNSAGLHSRRHVARFWASAAGFWSGPGAWRAWALCGSLLAIAVAQLTTQYLLNYWNRDFFNALEQRNWAAFQHSLALFFPLVALSTGLAVVSVWGRMTMQRNWRRYLTRHLLKYWLARGRYRSLSRLNGSNTPQNSEYRITEDARIATDAPVDLVLALFSSIMTIIIFFEVLWNVGGAIAFQIGGVNVRIPGYLAITVVAYSGLITAAVMVIGRKLTSVVQGQMQSEAVFRASANLIRVSGEGLLAREIETRERRDLWFGLRNVVEQWRRLCWQIMRVTLVTHTNTLLAPVVGLLLCTPKYLAGEMTLGEVTQAAAAFATVQGAFNWLVDNYQRMSDWRSSASRIAALLLTLDELTEARHPVPLRVVS